MKVFTVQAKKRGGGDEGESVHGHTICSTEEQLISK